MFFVGLSNYRSYLIISTNSSSRFIPGPRVELTQRQCTCLLLLHVFKSLKRKLGLAIKIIKRTNMALRSVTLKHLFSYELPQKSPHNFQKHVKTQ